MTLSIYERAQNVFPPTAGRYTKFGIVRGEGSYLYTDAGKRMLDFASGVAVCNVGHNHPKVAKAAIEQIHNLIHGGHNVVFYESYVKLGEKLVELTGNDTMVYFSNSGAEANEGSLKLAKYVSKRPAIISFKGGFHGRTLGTISITTSNSAFRKNYEGLLPSVYFAEYPYCYRCPFKQHPGNCNMECLGQFESIFKYQVDPDMIAAIIFEPIAGEGGYIVPPKEFVQGLREICNKNNIYLIFDEIQTGMGRTGKMFAYENYEIKPDIMSLGKAIGSGFPLSAVVAKRDIMKKWITGAHGGTFGGNPVSCAASIATINVLENGMLENAVKMGNYLRNKLNKMKNKYTVMGDVRGLGLMVAVEFVKENMKPNGGIVKKILNYCYNNGLIMIPCGPDKHVIRFIPATTVNQAEIDFALNVFEAGISNSLDS
jgi:4-aminobutyrate aminotransferase